jgi:hypothetical protein
MRGIVTWCVGALPFGANSRRAIDETLADWAYEEDYVKTGGERWRAGLRGVLSVALVVSHSIGREAFDFKWGHGLARRCGVVAGLVVLLTFLSGFMMPVAGTIEIIPVVLLGIPLHLLIISPPAIFLALAWRSETRSTPTVGTACFLTILTLLLSGWVVPLTVDMANDIIRQTVVMSDLDFPPRPVMPRGAIALAVTGWASLAGTSAILASVVANRSPLRSRWWLLAVPAIYLLLIPLFEYTIGSSFVTVGEAPSSWFTPGIASWTTASVIMLVALIYGRRDTPVHLT